MKEINEVIYTFYDIYTVTKMSPTQVVIDIVGPHSSLSYNDGILSVNVPVPHRFLGHDICRLHHKFVQWIDNVTDMVTNIVVSQDGKEAIVTYT